MTRAAAVRACCKLVLVPCLIAGWPVSARANGRFPAANAIVFAPDQGGGFIVRTTFGLLEARGSGEAPAWTCEQALGFVSEEDPLLVLTASGARVVATSSGAVVSTEGCSFEAVDGLDDQLVMDLTFDADRGRVLALGVEIGAGGSTLSRIFESSDDGTSFQPLGEPFPENLLPITLDAAPTDADRVYVTGRLKTDAGYSGVLYASTDGGEHFTEYAVPDTDSTRLPFLAAVNPTDPERVYIRVSDPDGSVLWTTPDAGASLSRITAGAGALLGFAVSPDGERIAFGGPEDGVWVGAADGAGAEPVNALPATCLGWAKSGLYACGSMSGDDDALVFISTDEGRTFDSVFKKSQLAGETGCTEDTPVGSTCQSAWPAVAALLTPQSPAPPDPPSGGQGGEAASEPAAGPREASGGCSVYRGVLDATAAWFLLLAGAFLVRRRHAPRSARCQALKRRSS